MLLLRYLETRYPEVADSEKAKFQALLNLQDPELIGYLLQGLPPAPEIADVVHAILDQACT